MAHAASCPMPATMAGATAGQAADDDVEECDNAVEDGLEDGGDGVDNAGETAANCCEERFDARDYGTHYYEFVVREVGVLVLGGEEMESILGEELLV